MKCVQIRSFFWSVFSRIWTKYGKIQSISPYSVHMRENTNQKKLRIWAHFMQCTITVKFILLVFVRVNGLSESSVLKKRRNKTALNTNQKNYGYLSENTKQTTISFLAE